MSLARPSPAIAPGTGIVPRRSDPIMLDGYGLSPKDLDALARFNPAFFAEYMAREEYKIRAEEKARCEESLMAFVIRAWREIEHRPFEKNWHHEVICQHLELISYGEIRNLIVNIPPRHTKPVCDDALVLTKARGLIRLGDIVVGDLVLTHKRRWKRVLAVHVQGELECLRIRTRAGRELELAPDHPVLTPEGWIQAWLLRPDDVVGVVPGLKAGEPTITVEEARLLGYFVGDGSVSHASIRVTCKDDFVARDVEACAVAVGMKPVEKIYPLKTRDIAVVSGLSRSEVHRHRFHRSMGFASHRETLAGAARGGKGQYGPVRRWLVEHGLDGKNSYTKRVPTSVMTGTDQIVCAFLGAYWSCDGFITNRGKGRDDTDREDLHIGCDSVSKELMLDMQQLLTRIGINSLVRTKFAKTVVTKRQGIGYTSYSLSLRSQDDCWRFAQLINLAHAKDERLRKAKRRRFDFDRDIWGEVVAEIEPIGKRPCRCLTVEGDKSFLANGFAVHNSLIVNVLWPAWTWSRSESLPLSGAHVKFLSVSYGATLSEELAVKMRRLVEGEWYQSHWGERTKLLEDQRNRANFANVSGGERMSASIEGGLIGRGGDVTIVDDPQTRRGADSAVERAASLQGMSDLQTRVTDPRISAQVLIQQRLHVSDATDWALKNWPSDTVHLMFPARFESDRACASDIRVVDGQLLWPTVWSEEELTRIEAGLAALDGDVLSDYAFSGQFQQNPRPRAGGIVNKDDWKVWPEWTPRVDDVRRTPSGAMFIPLPEVSRVILCLDTALSEKETADWNACVVLGVWHRSNDLVKIVGHEAKIDDGEQPRVIVMGAWRRRCKLNDETLGRDGKPQGLVQRVIDTGRRFNVDEVIIEDATRGKDVKNEIERQLSDLPFRIRLFNPKKHGDKTARLNSVQPLFSQGLVYMPGNCRVARDRAGAEYVVVDEFTWSQEIMTEVEAVPRGAHDDYADCISQGLLCLREDGHLALTQEYVAAQMAARMHRGKRTSVRDVYGV